MVLHPGAGGPGGGEPQPFQSPSRRGWSCIESASAGLRKMSTCFSPLLVGDGLASSVARSRRSSQPRFSPLLVGDGLASSEPGREGTFSFRGFSPLLVGDGLASLCRYCLELLA